MLAQVRSALGAEAQASLAAVGRARALFLHDVEQAALDAGLEQVLDAEARVTLRTLLALVLAAVQIQGEPACHDGWVQGQAQALVGARMTWTCHRQGRRCSRRRHR